MVTNIKKSLGMNKIWALILTAITIWQVLSVEGSGGYKWGYGEEDGPSNWAKLFFTCKGSRQSPINIETGYTRKEYWKPFLFKYYDETPTRLRVKNNGHTAQVEIETPNAPRISGGGLKGEYIFAQFHFHWGSTNSQGSEHTIDGVRYPLELHMVHFKSSYESLQGAVKHSDGLAVLGIMFEVSQTDNPALTPLTDSLDDITEALKISDVPAKYPLSAYLPADRESFFRYDGSLTTPTCNEVVIWTVFRQAVPISERQLEKFRELLTEDGEEIVDNFRPPQQLRSRKVYMSATGNSADGTSMKKLGLALYFMSSMAVIMMNM